MPDKKRAYIYVNYNNMVVIEKYLEIVKNALELKGYECEYTKVIDEKIDKKDLIVFPGTIALFQYYLKGYKNTLLWLQGATAAESYMRNKSMLRYWFFHFIDCFAIKKARMVMFVSEYMQSYYEKVLKCSLKEKAYIMPCFNEQYDESVFEKKDYTKRVFTYVGSLAVWQCFEHTMEIYSKIEKKIPNTFLKVLTFNVDDAKKIIEEKGIKNYEVKSVPQQEVNKELIEATYGFVIREDNIVNRVATPTKFSSYLAAGVFPIYSSCLRDFYSQAKDKVYAFSLNSMDSLEGLIDYLNTDIDINLAKNEIKELFDTYYSIENHTKNIVALIEKIFK